MFPGVILKINEMTILDMELTYLYRDGMAMMRYKVLCATRGTHCSQRAKIWV